VEKTVTARTGYREKEIVTVFLGAVWVSFCLLITSPPIRGCFLRLPGCSRRRERHPPRTSGATQPGAGADDVNPAAAATAAHAAALRSSSCCCCGGMRRFLQLDTDLIMDGIGSDAARYLMFQQLALRLFGALTLMALLVTVPVNMTGSRYDSYGSGPDVVRSSYFFMRTTFHNLEPSSPFLWLHLAIFYSQSIMLYYFIYLYHTQVVQLVSAVEAKSASAA
jgi:hypothetical protein